MIPAEKAESSPLILSDETANTVQKPATKDGTLPHIRPESSGRWALPVNVWARLVVLFIALAGIKAALMVRFGKGLFETHWRLPSHDVVWGDYVLFGLFVAIGFVSLIRLQRHCALVGIKAIRAANTIVLCLGLLFIFLTFHSQRNNYLYPILTAVLSWNSLIPYLSLDLFFHPPFLAGWLFIYALSYYVLTRTGRESWVLYMTAGFAAVYAALFLWELAVSRIELLVICSLGVASLLIGTPREQKIRMRWLLAPLAWGLFFAVELFWLIPQDLDLPLKYFELLSCSSVVLFVGATLLAYKRGFGPTWSRIALFYFASFLLLSSRNYPIAKNFNYVVCLGLEVPRYLFGEVLIIAILAGIAMGQKILFPKMGAWWLDIVNLVFIVIAFVDYRLSQLMGAQLGWDVLALGGNAKMIWRMVKPYLPGALLDVTILAVVYAIALRFAQFFIGRTSAARPVDEAKRSLSILQNADLRFAAAAFLLLGLVGIVTADPDKAESQSGLRLIATSPIWKRAMSRPLKPQEFLATARSLGLGEFNAMSATTSSPSDLNVVLVFMESTYNKHLSLFGGSEETQPLLSKYRERMEIYPNFFSSFADSIHARFATFTSLYPVRDYNAFTLQRVPVKSVFEVLHENGYSCSLFYSSFLDYTGFRSFLQGRGFDAVYDADTMPGQRNTEPVAWGLREEETLGAIRKQIETYATGNKRFFLTYVPAAPHYPHEKVPPQFHKYKPGDMGDYSALYYNELLYMDWVLASIVEQLEASHLLDKTVVIITNDHGEMLGERGGPIGHGFLLSPELVNTPLIIMDPRKPGYRINQTIGSQVDLLPTLLDLLGIPIPVEELYEGRSLGRAGERNSLIYLNSLQEYGVIDGNRLMLGDRERERGALTRAYTIGNSGAKTVFQEDGATSKPELSMQRFDDFQANLLRNYSRYQESLRKSRLLTSGR